MSDSDAARLSARVMGRVQGVGFRAFTRRRARMLGLTGWVRNEPDGSVRLEAEGAPAALDDFTALLREGPPGARVEHVAAERGRATGEFSGFSVRFV